MKTIYKNLVLTGVLALASTSLYAGDKASCHSDKAACRADHASYHHSSKANRYSHVRVERSLSASVQMYQNGYMQTSKGIRLAPTDRFYSREDRNIRTEYRVVQRDANWHRDWNRDVNQSKDYPNRNI